MLRRLLPSRIIFLITILTATGAFCEELGGDDETKKKVDSLFVLSCGGLEKYRDLQQPAESTLIAMGEEAVSHLLGRLNTQSAREKWTLIRILGKIGEPAVMPLVDSLDSKDKEVTKLSVRILGDIKDSRAVRPLVALLTRKDYNIRSDACESLGKTADTSAFTDVSLRMEDSVEVVRKSAAVALGRMNDQRGIPYLVKGMSDSHFSVRMSSANSLVAIGQPAVASLLPLLDNAGEPTMNLAIESLGRLKTKEALPLLVNKLGADSWSTRAFAVEALGEIGDQRGLRAVKTMKKLETHPFVLGKIEQYSEDKN
jgi:HEAT repeat protein